MGKHYSVYLKVIDKPV